MEENGSPAVSPAKCSRRPTFRDEMDLWETAETEISSCDVK